MVFVVMVVLLASFALIQHRVNAYFEATLREQYAEQFQLTKKGDADRLAAYSSEISNNTSNPRLLAALYEEDLSRFYYDLSQELKSFHRNIEERYSSARLWSFFRFVNYDGRYLIPPAYGQGEVSQATNALPGVLSPFDESQLESLFGELGTRDDEALESRSGYLVAHLNDEPVLIKTFVCPVTDAFGVFLGDLVLAIPLQAEDEGGAKSVMAVKVEGKLFDRFGQVRTGPWSELAVLLSKDGVESGKRSVRISGERYLVFSELLSESRHFPVAERAILFSMAEQERLLAGIRGVFILFGVLGLLCSSFLSHVLAGGLHAPVLHLKQAAQRLGKGDFATRVEIRSRDELQLLGEAFNDMAAGLELKERYKAVLSKVADPKVADRLMAEEINLGGETVSATVLFCDIRGFTPLTEGMDPQGVIDLVNEHMTGMTECVSRHGGVVDKFVGDEIMVLFGLPVPDGNDAERALRCAEAMIQQCRAMNANREQDLTIGIGVAHGEMVAGCMGSEDRLNYSVLGDRVNLASRLCSKAGPMEILADEPTCLGAGRDVSDLKVGAVALKGFEQPPPFYILKDA